MSGSPARAQGEAGRLPIRSGKGRPTGLRRDVRIESEKIRRVVCGLDLAQPGVVLAERRPHLLRPVVLRQVVDVRGAQRCGSSASHERPHPGDVVRGLAPLGPLADGVEVPLRPSRGKGGVGRRDARRGAVHVEEDQRAERRAEARRAFDQRVDEVIGDLLGEGRAPVAVQPVHGVRIVEHRLARARRASGPTRSAIGCPKRRAGARTFSPSAIGPL